MCIIKIYSSTKNEIVLFAETWIELRISILSEPSQLHRDNYLLIFLFLSISLGVCEGWIKRISE